MYKSDQIKIYNLFADVSDTREHWLRILYSAFYFSLTSIALTYLGYLLLSLNASYLDYQPVFSFNGIDKLTDTYGWSVKRIAFVYLCPPLLGAAASLFGLYKYRVTHHNRPHLQLFYFWLAVNGFVLFYTYLISGAISVGNYHSKYFMGIVAFLSWLDWGNKVVLGILIFLSALFAFYPLRFGWPVTKSYYSRKLLKKRVGRQIMFINIVVLPCLIGLVINMAAIFPMDILYQAFHAISYLMVFAMILWRTNNQRKKVGRLVKGGASLQSPLLLFSLVAGLIAIGRILLSIEIHF